MNVEDLPVIHHGPAPSPVTHAYPHLNKPQLHHRKHRWSSHLILAAITITLGSSIPLGYKTGVINNGTKVIDEWAQSSMVREHNNQLGVNQQDFKHILNIGGIIGSIASLWLADHLGRKKSIIFSNFLSIFACVLCLLTPATNSVEVLFTARLISGISSGVITSIAPMYLVELSPLRLKGAMGATFSFGVAIGTLVSHTLSMPSLLATQELWPILLALDGVFILLSWLLFMFLPESPRFLYSVKGMKQNAIIELSALRGVTLKQAEYELKDHNAPIGDLWTLKRLFSNRDILLQVAVLCALLVGQQFSGIDYLLNTSLGHFSSLDLSRVNARIASLSIFVIHCSLSIVMLYFVNECRRKRLIVLSCSLSSLTLILFTVTGIIDDTTDWGWAPIAAEVSLMLFVVAFTLGLQSIPYFLGAELFDVGPRSAAMALGSATNWTARFVAVLGIPLIHNVIKQYLYLVFAMVTAVIAVFTQCCLPETKLNLKRKPLPKSVPKRVSFMDDP